MLRLSRPLILLLSLDLCACATFRAYPGEARDAADVALLRPTTVRGQEISIEAVDGRALGPLQVRAELLPGTHRVRVRLILRAGRELAGGSHELEFIAEAGRDYRVHGDWHIYGPRVWITQGGEVLALVETPPRRLPPVGARPRRVRSESSGK